MSCTLDWEELKPTCFSLRNDPLVDANGSSRVSRVNVCDRALLTDGPAASRILRRGWGLGGVSAASSGRVSEGGRETAFESNRCDPVTTRGENMGA
jgi:hypothetical protein